MIRKKKRICPIIARAAVAAAFATAPFLSQIDDGGIVSSAAAQTSGPQARWLPTGSLNVPRKGHTATLLRDGRVLVTGGANRERVESSAELYDPVRGVWQLTESMHAQRYGHTATQLLDGRVLVVGGTQQAPWINSAEIFDPVSGAWTLTAPMVYGRIGHSATLLADGSVLVAGGQRRVGSMESTASVEIFDPAAGTWNLTGALVRPRQEHAAMRLSNGDVMVFGGWNYDPLLYDPQGPLVDEGTERYSAVTRSWSLETVGARNDIFGRAALSLPDGKLALVGGYRNSIEDDVIFTRTSIGTVEFLSPTGNTLPDAEILLAYPRQRMTATALPTGEMLVVGGLNGNIEEWPVGTMTADIALAETITVTGQSGRNGHGTTRASSLITARHDHTATLLQNGSVLVVGGAMLAADGGEFLPGTGTLIREMALSSAELYGDFPAGTIEPSFTGTWFDPSQSGHGLFVQVLPNNHLLAAWFTFNPAGTEQSWFIGTGSYSGNTATVTSVVQPMGGRWIPNFDPAHVVNNPWGSLTFTFTDCNHGRVEFNSTAGYGAGSMNLTRLTQPAGLACP